MSVEREYTDYLRDILDAIDKAGRFVQGVSETDFLANDEKIYRPLNPFKRSIIDLLTGVGGATVGKTSPREAPEI